jgi:hypothetical protein
MVIVSKYRLEEKVPGIFCQDLVKVAAVLALATAARQRAGVSELAWGGGVAAVWCLRPALSSQR